MVGTAQLNLNSKHTLSTTAVWLEKNLGQEVSILASPSPTEPAP